MCVTVYSCDVVRVHQFARHFHCIQTLHLQTHLGVGPVGGEGDESVEIEDPE